MRTQNGLSAIAVVIAAGVLHGCGGTPATSSGPIVLKGAGATAPYLAYAKWVTEFNKESGPALQLQYQPTGSGDGIRQLEAGAVDFAASDIPLDDAQIANLKPKPIHFPTLTGAIVPVYNIPDLSKDIQFTGEALAGIFSGKVKTWNNTALTSVNEDLALPTHAIVIVHRSDASGSTYALTDFLSQVSPAWKTDIGKGATVKWPGGQEASGNEAVAELVKKTPYSIGYVELNYAIEQKLAYGPVRNAAGKFQKPTLEAQNAAVRAAPELEKDSRASIVNAAAPEAYPICTLTWLVVPSEFPDVQKQKAMKRFLRWAYASGLKLAMPMDYGIVPPELVARMGGQIESIH